MARAGAILQAASHWSLIRKIMLAMIPKKVLDEHRKHKEMAKQKLSRRLEMDQDRSDLVAGLLKDKGSQVRGIHLYMIVEAYSLNSAVIIT
jgi:hypothetical protein